MMELIHEPDITILIAKLKDTDKDVRYGAAYALGLKREVSAIPDLIAALKDVQPVRGIAAVALKFIGSPSVPALSLALQDEDRFFRCRAVKALEEIGGTATVPVLRQALEDKVKSVRDCAAAALKKAESTQSASSSPTSPPIIT